MKTHNILVKISLLFAFMFLWHNTPQSWASEPQKWSSPIEASSVGWRLNYLAANGMNPSSSVAALKKDLNNVIEKITAQKTEAEQQLSLVEAKLSALGEPPKTDDATDSKKTEAITALMAERNELSNQAALLKSNISRMKLAIVQLQQTREEISAQEYGAFMGYLLDEQPHAFSKAFWSLDPQVWSQIPDTKIITETYPAMAIVAILFVLMLATYVGNRAMVRTVQSLTQLSSSNVKIPYQLALLGVRTVPVLLIHQIGLLLLQNIQGFNLQGQDLVASILWTIVLAHFATGILRSYIAPDIENFSPTIFQNVNRKKIYARASLTVALLAVGNIAGDTLNLLNLDISAASLPRGFLICAAGISLISLAWITTKTTTQEEQPIPYLSHLFLKFFVQALGLASIILVLAGLPNVSATILDSVILLSILAILYHFVHDGSSWIVGRIGQNSPKFAASSGTWQLFVLLADIILITLVSLGVSRLYGGPGEYLAAVISDMIVGVNIAGYQISLLSIFIGFAIFMLVIALTNSLKQFLGNNVLPRTPLDRSAQDSLRQTVGYVGYIIAFLLALSYSGINLSSFALIASALTVGIGFGLQNIVNNFVSGLILLAERPIKVGDWIVAGNYEGYVQKVNVRATEITTFDRSSVIIPNAELISQPVVNWFYKSKQGRVIVNIGVAYDSDPEQVRDLLLQVAHNHPLVQPLPQPSVFFVDFAESSLNFSLRCFILDYSNSLGVASDLRFEINKLFAQHKIKIPYPQRDLYVHQMPDRVDSPSSSG